MTDASEHPFDRHLHEVTPRAEQLTPWTPADGALPALYLSHGAPPLFEDDAWMRQLFEWAHELPKPKAVAHRLGALGAGAAERLGTDGRHPAGVRLRRLRPDVLPDALHTPDASELARGSPR